MEAKAGLAKGCARPSRSGLAEAAFSLSEKTRRCLEYARKVSPRLEGLTVGSRSSLRALELRLLALSSRIGSASC